MPRKPVTPKVKRATSITLRTFQLLFTVLMVCLVGYSVELYVWPSNLLTLSSGIISFIYLILSLSIAKHLCTLAVIILECIIAALMITSFGLLLEDFSLTNNCLIAGDSYTDGWQVYTDWYLPVGCVAARAATAFAFILFIFYAITIILHSVYALAPSTKHVGGVTETGVLSVGSIFLTNDTFEGPVKEEYSGVQNYDPGYHFEKQPDVHIHTQTVQAAPAQVPSYHAPQPLQPIS